MIKKINKKNKNIMFNYLELNVCLYGKVLVKQISWIKQTLKASYQKVVFQKKHPKLYIVYNIILYLVWCTITGKHAFRFDHYARATTRL